MKSRCDLSMREVLRDVRVRWTTCREEDIVGGDGKVRFGWHREAVGTDSLQSKMILFHRRPLFRCHFEPVEDSILFAVTDFGGRFSTC